MKQYRVAIEKKVEKAIERFPLHVQVKTMKAIDDLASNPRPSGKPYDCKKIGPGAWRIKVGRNYRLIYTIDEVQREVLVLKATKREGAYG